MGRKKKEYPYDGKTLYGASTMSIMSVGVSSFMSTMFMVYLTDYAGLGAWGASLATVVLMIARVVDAVNDPLQGWIMDNAKYTRFGKYRKFMLGSIIFSGVAVIFLYNLPKSFTSNKILVAIWILAFYLVYDFASSFNSSVPLIQSATQDEALRSKFLSIQRIVSMVVTIPITFYMVIVLQVNNIFNDLHKSIGVVVACWMTAMIVLFLSGILCFKEGKPIKADKEEPINLKKIIAALKVNKALQVHMLASFFNGFIYTLIFATNSYYIRWAYCANLETGEMDLAKLGTLSAVVGLLQIIPILIAAALSTPITKKLGSPMAALRLSIWLASVPGVILFVLQITGILQRSLPLFIILLAIELFGIGLTFVPGFAILMECIDYNAYKTGDEMGGQINALSNFLGKVQSAISTVVVGAALVIVGYSVDSATGNYVGELSRIPGMLNGFMVISGLAPTILGLISLVIYKRYPITNEIRADMHKQRMEAMQQNTQTEA